MKLVFEWDATKAAANLRKHKVGFPEAKTIFNDPFLATFADTEHSAPENRLISIGMSTRGRVLLAVHTEATDGETLAIRLISCRIPTNAERQVYEEAE